MFNRHQFFFTNKQYVKVKLMQNETNLRSIFFFFDKGEILVKLWLKGLNYHNFIFFIITNFKTDRYLNNFQEHLFGILRPRKYQTPLQNFFHVRTRLLNMTLSNLRFNVWRSFVTMVTNLPSCFLIQFLEQLLKFLLNFTLLKYVKSQRSYDFLITKELIFGFQILNLHDHFSASLIGSYYITVG